MHVEPLAIPGVKLITPTRHGDNRGFFSEVFNAEAFRTKAGIEGPFAQDNHSLSIGRGVVRGLHFQTPPMAQDKLLRVTRGVIFDVVVDLRHGSPTFGRHVSVELSAENWTQIWVPEGCAHGFCTLTEETEVIYKVTRPYSPEHDKGVRWNDPDLAVKWPLGTADVTLSDKDARQPLFAGLPRYFEFQD